MGYLEDVKRDMEAARDDDESEDDKVLSEVHETPEEKEANRRAAKKKLQSLRAVYYSTGTVFTVMAIKSFLTHDLVSGFVFFALGSVVMVFGHICESAIKTI